MTNNTEKIYTVSEITGIIKSRLEGLFPKLWIEGEISNFHRHQSGHLYFTLKDDKAQLKGVMFRSGAQKVAFELKNGLQIVCRGRLNVYVPRGDYQLMIDLIEPKGKGALQLAFEQLKEKLSKEGLFDPSIKKKIPMLPKKIGIVTSPRGAAIVDILRTMERRFVKTHVIVYPAKVQGEGAAEEIVEGIEFMSRYPGLDVLIVGRGGGSIEDLWAFNEEKVARAIFRCPIPVISAVGHEIDFTIADFVADIRASTPSAAAEMVLEKEQSFYERIDNLESRMQHLLRYAVQERRNEVLSLIHHQAFQNFKMKLFNLAQSIDDLQTRALNRMKDIRQELLLDKSRTLVLQERIIGVFKNDVQKRLSGWEKLTAALNSFSPLSILQKGYALCWNMKDGSLVKEAGSVGQGDEVAVSFAKGELSCLVSRVDAEKTIESRIVKRSS
jgi:exodeoxyribonuclease VII large subunit